MFHMTVNKNRSAYLKIQIFTGGWKLEKNLPAVCFMVEFTMRMFNAPLLTQNIVGNKALYLEKPKR